MSLRSRLVLAVAAVALVALIVADVAVYSALRSSLMARNDQSLQQTAASLPLRRFAPPGFVGRTRVGSGGGVTVEGGNAAQQAGGAGGSGTVAGAPSSAAAAGGSVTPTEGPTPTTPGQPPRYVTTHAPGLFVEVLGSDGKVRYGPFPGYEGGAAYSPKLPAHITGFSRASPTEPPQVFFSASSTKAGGPQFRVVAVRQPNGEVLVVGRSLSDTTSTLDQLLLIEVVVTAAALVAAVALGWWLVRLGLKPLADVEDTAERIAGGDLGQRVPGENDRTEVGRLARTLNIMLSRIEGAFAQRAATESALRRSEEQLRRFVADASHELRTPLAAVGAYAELFERGARGHPEDLERVMRGIQRETSRMGQLVEDLLLLARLDEGLPLEQAPVDLVNLAGDAVHTALTVGPAWPVTLVAGAPIEVIGDDHRLRQVLDNLLANIRAHTPEGTAATVRVELADGGAVVEVADGGPGMDPEQAARMFERFYRADPSRSRANGGTGLGLSIVAAIVAAHGGEVTASSRQDGGTLVRVWLPLPPDSMPAEGDRDVASAVGGFRAADDGGARADRPLDEPALASPSVDQPIRT